MSTRVVARVPPQLLQRGRVLRPVDAQNIYTNPRAEFARLERQGALHRLAPGLYAAVPEHAVGGDWLPPSKHPRWRSPPLVATPRTLP